MRGGSAASPLALGGPIGERERQLRESDERLAALKSAMQDATCSDAGLTQTKSGSLSVHEESEHRDRSAMRQSHPIKPTSKAPSRKRRSRFRKTRHILPAEKRARTVAKIIKELGVLKPGMYGQSDYDHLREENTNFLTFKVAEKRADLQTKILNLQANRRYYRLAQELAAAYHGRELSTLQTDWKKHKPKKFRRTSS